MSSQLEIKIIVNKPFTDHSTDVHLYLNNQHHLKFNYTKNDKIDFQKLFVNISMDNDLIHKLNKNWNNINFGSNACNEIKEPTADELNKNFKSAFNIDYDKSDDDIEFVNQIAELNKPEIIENPLQTLLNNYSKELESLQKQFESKNFCKLSHHEQNDIIESISLIGKLTITTNKRLNRINFNQNKF